jgi:hypothetical protein
MSLSQRQSFSRKGSKMGSKMNLVTMIKRESKFSRHSMVAEKKKEHILHGYALFMFGPENRSTLLPLFAYDVCVRKHF